MNPKSLIRSFDLQPLESRVFLSSSPYITGFFADNRGRVTLNISSPLNAATVNTNTAALFTAGPDGILGTSDDVKQSVRVAYSATNDRINIVTATPLPAGTHYRIIVKGNLITGTNGVKLDGEYNGDNVASGNGAPGGNFKFQTAGDPTNKVVRFYTDFGVINVQLEKTRTPKTVQNFLYYANNGLYDTSFFHRSVPGFIIQGGGYDVVNGQINAIPTIAPVVNEPGISNTLGTIAMAKLGDDPNSATDQWFFNEADNSSNLNNQNGGFTVFGHITNAAGLSVMNAIGALPQVNNGSPFDQLPVKNYTSGATTNANLVYVNRVGVRMATDAIARQESAIRAALPSAAGIANMLPPPRSVFSQEPISGYFAHDAVTAQSILAD